MLEPTQIKQEKSDPRKKNALVCTCECDVKKKLNLKKVRQVLVNFGLNRKKVFTLNGKNETLYEQFKKHILSEPAFSELLDDSYVVFQEFSEKFGTWVDIDDNEKLKDGTVLNAVFFPSNIERDESNPGYVKKKEICFVTGKVNKKRPSEIINIDLSDEDEQSTSSVNNAKHCKKSKFSKARIEGPNNGEEIEVRNFKNNEKKSKKVKFSVLEVKKGEEQENQEKNLKKNKDQLEKKNKILPEENYNKAVDSKLMKNMETSAKKDEVCLKKYENSKKTNVGLSQENSQNDDESKPINSQKNSDPNKRRHQEESDHSTWNRDLNLSLHQQSVHREIHRRRSWHYPETTDNFPASKNAWQKNGNETPKTLVQNGNSYVSQIYNVCAQNKWPVPEFTTREESDGFLCQLKVRDTTYYKIHSDSSKVEEAVAKLALDCMKEGKLLIPNTSNTRYQGSWQRGRRRPYREGYMKNWRNEQV
ncbi:hypothetical protein R5R35_007689 [Gryllus longicercus]|uniref:Uncharacterized protein n=1 Tax=Gryllus longicercus TaxID=2509291 RepID=A0AAN9Z195_9ORTH